MGALPPEIEPELATLETSAPAGPEWLHEIKYDGYRLVCRIEEGDVRLISRNGKDWTHRFLEAANAMRALPCRRAIVDGEVAVQRANGKTSFQDLQNYLGGGARGALRYFLFDLMYLEDEDLRSLPLIERKRRLAELMSELPAQGVLQYSDHVEGRGRAFYQQVCEYGLEGILSKRKNSKYRSGRTRDWLKIKCLREANFVVGGYTEPGGTRHGFGALLIGGYDRNGELRFGGRVGTGFSDDKLRDLFRRLESLERKQSPFVDGPEGRAARDMHWIEPELVARVAYVEWTDEGVVRHPAFKQLCDDVDPGSVILDRIASAELEEDSAEDGTDEAPDSGEYEESIEVAEVGREPAAPPVTGTASRSRGPRASGVTISSPEKIMYPDDAITKLDVARYYEAAGEWMIRFARERPLTLVRCPGGIRDCFYQKHVEGATHASVRKIPIAEDEAEGDYAMVETSQGLVALAQLGVLEFHTWGSRWSTLETPDRFTIDLDPDPDLPWIRVVEAAFDVRGWVEDLRLSAFVKTTGGKGLHVVVPITPGGDWNEVKEFSRLLAAAVEADWPKRYTLNISKERRKGRILLDYLRNGRGATAVEAYSTRSRPGAPVSTPITWEELTSGVLPSAFTLRTVPDRLASLRADPWQDYDRSAKPITRAMKTAVGMD